MATKRQIAIRVNIVSDLRLVAVVKQATNNINHLRTCL